MLRPGFLSAPALPPRSSGSCSRRSLSRSWWTQTRGQEKRPAYPRTQLREVGGGGGRWVWEAHPELDSMGEKLGVEQRLEHQPSEMLLERKPHSHPPCTTTSLQRPDQPPHPLPPGGRSPQTQPEWYRSPPSLEEENGGGRESREGA